jgi:copper chaperone
MKLQFKVPDMTCGGCVSNITRAIKTVDTNATIQGDPQTKIVLVETKSPESEIKAALTQAGYPAS